MRNVIFGILVLPLACSLAAAQTPVVPELEQPSVPPGFVPPTVDEKCGALVGSVFVGKEVPGYKGSTAGLTTPTVIPGTKVSPTFSEKALKAGGKVHLSAIVCKDGSVQGVEVVKAPAPDAGTAAVEAVRQWKFTPAMKGGTAVAVRYMVSVDVKP